MIRVLHTYRTYFPDPPGGTQETIRQMALATQAHGVRSTIFTLSPQPIPARLEYPEGLVVRERSWMAPASCDLGGIAAFQQFAALVKDADVLHYHFPYPFADVLHLTNGRKKPSILTYHSDLVRQRALGRFYAPLMWRMLLQMDIIIATSPNYASSSPILTDPRIRDRVRVVPFSIDQKTYPSVADQSILARLELTEPFFLFVGVCRYYKGLEYLIAAAQRVNAKVVIAGSGGELPRLRQIVAQRGITNVIFAGQVSSAEKVALLSACLAFVLPSHLRSEAFGVVLMEAAMFGKAMITCEIGTGTSFVNLHQETGLVVAPANVDALAVAMNRMLTDRQMVIEMGQRSKQRYEGLFSGERLGMAYAAVYKEALGI